MKIAGHEVVLARGKHGPSDGPGKGCAAEWVWEKHAMRCDVVAQDLAPLRAVAE